MRTFLINLILFFPQVFQTVKRLTKSAYTKKFSTQVYMQNSITQPNLVMHLINRALQNNVAYSRWTDETPDVIPVVRGSPLSRQTPCGSSLTNKAKTLCELHAWVSLLPESPNVIAKMASNPPAPGTPASRTPSAFIVESKSWVWDSGSICNSTVNENAKNKSIFLNASFGELLYLVC